jgi:Protein of unknown function (DUF1566)
MKRITEALVYPIILVAGFSLVLYTSHGALAGQTALVPRTGQTQAISNTPGSDGILQKGVEWPRPRFTKILDHYGNPKGSVKDNLTKLQWLQNANCFGSLSWVNALDAVVQLNSGIAPAGNCGYTGNKTDWRLPNVKELQSLIDYGCGFPALSDQDGSGCFNQDPSAVFVGVGTGHIYWSSTRNQDHNADDSFWVEFLVGNSSNDNINQFRFLVWPVRGGK